MAVWVSGRARRQTDGRRETPGHHLPPPVRRGGERPHPLDLAQALANFIPVRQAFQTLVIVLDLGIELLKPLIPLMQQRPAQVRHPFWVSSRSSGNAWHP